MRLISGVLFCLLIIGSIQQVVIDSIIHHPAHHSVFHKIVIVFVWILLLRLFLFDKKAKQKRMERYGSSNIFIALFKKEKK